MVNWDYSPGSIVGEVRGKYTWNGFQWVRYEFAQNGAWMRCAWGDAHNADNSPCRGWKHVWIPNTHWEHFRRDEADYTENGRALARLANQKVDSPPVLVFLYRTDIPDWVEIRCSCGWTRNYYWKSPEICALPARDHFELDHS